LKHYPDRLTKFWNNANFETRLALVEKSMTVFKGKSIEGIDIASTNWLDLDGTVGGACIKDQIQENKN
jgi:hypothetical protein